MSDSEPTAQCDPFEARVLVLGQFTAYLFRRLGAPEHLVQQWWQAWHAGDLTRLCACQNELEQALRPPLKPRS